MISQADQPGTPWKEGSESSLRETHTQGPGGPRHLCSPLATTVLHLPLGLPQTPNHLLVAEGAPDPNQVQLPLPPLGNARVSLCLILLHLVLVGPSRGLSSCPTPYQAAVLPTLPGPAAEVCIPCLPGSTDGQRMDSAVCLHPHGHPQTHSDTPGASAPTGTPQGGRYGVGGVSGGRPGVLRAAWHKGEEADHCWSRGEKEAKPTAMSQRLSHRTETQRRVPTGTGKGATAEGSQQGMHSTGRGGIEEERQENAGQHLQGNSPMRPPD